MSGGVRRFGGLDFFLEVWRSLEVWWVAFLVIWRFGGLEVWIFYNRFLDGSENQGWNHGKWVGTGILVSLLFGLHVANL